MQRLAVVLMASLSIAGFAQLTAADSSDCAMCHEDQIASMTHEIHQRIRSFEVQGRLVGCESCHGDGTAHMDEGDPTLVRNFSQPADDQVCQSCHRSKVTLEWDASTHASEGMTCLDCHSIHTEDEANDSCASCHADTIAAFSLPSHHPVNEGKMDCNSCHDPHAATEAQLKTWQRVNDLCFECHQSKEGPFIFEHEPVVEDCRLCHNPHGTVADNLLTANEPMLCYQCHEPHFHAGLLSPDGLTEIGGTEYENPFGSQSMNVAFTTRCSQCHSQIHGSDLPSQTLAGGGRGLVR